MKLSAIVVFAASFAALLSAQPKNPLVAPEKAAYDRIKGNFIKAAEKMPEENYSFKPAPEVETFAQRVAHITNQIRACSAVNGAPKQPETGKTSKADLVAGLKASFDECDKAWEGTTEANAYDMVNAGRGQTARLQVLIGQTIHANEVYGAMGVYMRMKGIVPPSSEPR